MTASKMRRVLVVVANIGLAEHRRLHQALTSFLPVVTVLGTGAFAADLRGTARLLGTPERVALRAIRAARDLGLRASAGIASGAFAARALAERTPPGTARTLSPHEERAFLATLSVDALPLEEEVVEELRLLGIKRAGELAVLPRASVLDRFGWGAAHAHALACGDDPEALVATQPAERLVAQATFEGPIASFEPLVFALRRVVDELAVRLRDRGLAALRLGVRLDREDAHALRFERVALPPTSEPAALLRSLRWMLEERKDLGGVAGVELTALGVEPARGRQLGLFAPDGARREDALAVASYLRSRLGEETVVRARVDEAERLPERRARFEEVIS